MVMKISIAILNCINFLSNPHYLLLQFLLLLSREFRAHFAVPYHCLLKINQLAVYISLNVNVSLQVESVTEKEILPSRCNVQI